jgi:hypothetical protein
LSRQESFAIAASHPSLTEDLCSTLKKKYTITESDNLKSFLGIHIVQDNNRLYRSQPGHISKLARTAGITATSKPVYISMHPSFNDEEQNDSPPANKSEYSTLLGMLIYVLKTRSDVAYAVNRLATRASNPTTKDLSSLKQVAAYLYTTSHLELCYNSSSPSNRTTMAQLFAYSNAAYLTHSDSKLHSGLTSPVAKKPASSTLEAKNRR